MSIDTKLMRAIFAMDAYNQGDDKAVLDVRDDGDSIPVSV
jgi:hypothetical protein